MLWRETTSWTGFQDSLIGIKPSTLLLESKDWQKETGQDPLMLERKMAALALIKAAQK